MRIVVTALLILTLGLIVESAEDFYDHETDPPYERDEKSGYEEPEVPAAQTQKPIVLENFKVVRLRPFIRVITPKGPDEIGSIEGMPEEVWQENEKQLDQETSDSASDQLVDAHEPMLHDDNSLSGRGSGVGYYQEASIVESEEPAKRRRTKIRRRRPKIAQASTPCPSVGTTFKSKSKSSFLPKDWLQYLLCIILLILFFCVLVTLCCLCCRKKEDDDEDEEPVTVVTHTQSPEPIYVQSLDPQLVQTQASVTRTGLEPVMVETTETTTRPITRQMVTMRTGSPRPQSQQFVFPID